MRPDNPAEEPEGVMASDNQGLMGVPLMLGLVYGFHALAMIFTWSSPNAECYESFDCQYVGTTPPVLFRHGGTWPSFGNLNRGGTRWRLCGNYLRYSWPSC